MKYGFLRRNSSLLLSLSKPMFLQWILFVASIMVAYVDKYTYTVPSSLPLLKGSHTNRYGEVTHI